jgi:hypothetical protein
MGDGDADIYREAMRGAGVNARSLELCELRSAMVPISREIDVNHRAIVY